MRDVKFYAKDILRGWNADTLVGYYTFAVVLGFCIGGALALVVLGLLNI